MTAAGRVARAVGNCKVPSGRQVIVVCNLSNSHMVQV